MESLDIKKHPSDKQIAADRQQVKEWLKENPITRIEDGAWKRNGEVVKQAPPPKEFSRDEAVISPWNWR
jgi:hypothetical protein